MGIGQGKHMPRIENLTLVWSSTARYDLIKLREFIQAENPRSAQRSSEKIIKAVKLILNNLAIGIQLEGREDRELFTSFGKNGYILRYQIIDQKVVVLKIWHTREDR